MSVLLAMFVFVLSHAVIARSRLKPWLIQRTSHAAYLIGYSVLSAVLLAHPILFGANPWLLLRAALAA